MEQKTELKDLRQHIEAEKIITPAEWKQDYNIYEAATFNLAHNAFPDALSAAQEQI